MRDYGGYSFGLWLFILNAGKIARWRLSLQALEATKMPCKRIRSGPHGRGMTSALADGRVPQLQRRTRATAAMFAVPRAVAFAAFVVAGIAAGVAPAFPCTPVRHSEEARYVGGDLLTQIARKAYAIELVRTVDSARTDRFTTIYIGDTREGRRIHRFRLQVVRRLAAPRFFLSAAPPRQLFLNANLARSEHMSGRSRMEMPNARVFVVPLRYDRPTHRGIVIGHAVVEAGTEGSCQEHPMRLRLGDLFIAVRKRDGGLYDAGLSGAGSLPIDIEFPTEGPSTVAAPSFIRLEGPDDPILHRLERALSANRRLLPRREVNRFRFFDGWIN